MIGQHALERFAERFPKIALEIGFLKKWEDNPNDRNKEYNTFLFYELMKKSEEVQTIKNDMASLIEICENNNIEDWGNFKVFRNGEILFLCESKKVNRGIQNVLIVKTVVPTSFSIGRFIHDRNKKDLNLEDTLQSEDFSLISIDKVQYKRSVRKLYNDNREHILFCDRLKKIYEQNTQEYEDRNFLKKEAPPEEKIYDYIFGKTEYDHLQLEQVAIVNVLQEKLGKYGIRFVMNMSRDKSLIYLTDEYKGHNNQKNKLKLTNYKALLQILDRSDVFEHEGRNNVQNFLSKRITDVHETRNVYEKLLINASRENNNTVLPLIDLKNIIIESVPEEIKADLKINSKTLSGDIQDNFSHLFIKQEKGLKNYINLIKKNKERLNIVWEFKYNEINQANRNCSESFCLCKDKITGELSIDKFLVSNNSREKSDYTVTMNMEEYLNAINDFALFFDNLETEQKSFIQKSVFEFVKKEISKYENLDKKIEQIISNNDLSMLEMEDGGVSVLMPQLKKHDMIGDKKVTIKKQKGLNIIV